MSNRPPTFSIGAWSWRPMVSPRDRVALVEATDRRHAACDADRHVRVVDASVRCLDQGVICIEDTDRVDGPGHTGPETADERDALSAAMLCSMDTARQHQDITHATEHANAEKGASIGQERLSKPQDAQTLLGPASSLGFIQSDPCCLRYRLAGQRAAALFCLRLSVNLTYCWHERRTRRSVSSFWRASERQGGWAIRPPYDRSSRTIPKGDPETRARGSVEHNDLYPTIYGLSGHFGGIPLGIWTLSPKPGESPWHSTS